MITGSGRFGQGVFFAVGVVALAAVALGLASYADAEEEAQFFRPRVTPPQEPQAVAFMATTVVAGSADALLDIWRHPQSLPLVLRFLHRVEPLDEKHSRWTLRSTLGESFVLELKLVRDVAHSVLVWELCGNGVEGTLRVDITQHESTAKPLADLTVGVDLRTQPTQDGLPQIELEAFFGNQPAQRLADDLRRLSLGIERGLVKV